MVLRWLVFILIFQGFFPLFSGELRGRWSLERSELTYKVTHPLHIVHGKSTMARGKGVCYKGFCEFHLGVLVRTFDSGDANRDLHMLEVTKAGLYPLIDVKAVVKDPDSVRVPGPLKADITVKFAGKTVPYPGLGLESSVGPDGTVRITGEVPLSLRAYGIVAPSLLTMPVQDEVPVKLDLYWKNADPTGSAKN